MKKVTKLYKFAVIATDQVVFSLIEGRLQVLLIKMKKAPYENAWAAPGGLVNSNEGVEQAAKRVLQEKTGLKGGYSEQLFTFGDVDRDPFGRVVSVAYLTLLSSSKMKLITTSEYDGIEWFAIDELPELAYDHKQMIRLAAERLASKLEYTNIVCNLLPDEFTLSQMQEAYEAILGRELDKRNFRKKVLSLQIVKTTGKRQAGLQSRPALLYRSIYSELRQVEIL